MKMSSPAAASLIGYAYCPMASTTSTRYVKLLPGAGEDRIECDIFEASTVNYLPYTALSYSWGSCDNLQKIYCSDGRYLEVTPNLYQALRQIRSPTESQTFWIDAICVNQKDVDERNHQVAQMKQIYSQSQKLVIWLGSSGDKAAHELVTRLAALVDDAEQPGPFQSQPWIENQHWRALSASLTSEWFRRMWVIQELVLGLQMDGPNATEVLFGSHSVTWSQLARCCGYINNHYARLFEHPAHVADAGTIRRGVTRVANLHGMAIRAPKDLTYSEWMVWLLKKLTTSRNKRTTEPKDKVFALYGLCCAEPQPLPNYKLSVADVYRTYAIETIRATKSLAILSQIEVRSQSSQVAVPSWVPDWSVGLERYNTLWDEDLLKSVGLSEVPGDFASLEIEDATTPNVLHLAGNIADQVAYIGPSVSRKDVEALYSGKKSWVSNLWRFVEHSKYLDCEPGGSQKHKKALQTGTANNHEGGLKALRAKISRLTILPSRRKKQPQEHETYNKDEARFGKFVRTLIAYVKIPGLEELIGSGEERFLELLNYTAQNQTRPRRFSTGRKASLLTLDEENNRFRTPSVPEIILTTEISGSGSAPSSSPARLASKFTAAEHLLMETYLSVLHEWTHSKRFFISKQGYMGFGIKTIKADDHLAVLSAYGNPGRSLFSIRQTGTRYSFVGEAYVHGLKFNDGANKTWQEIELE